MVPTNSAVRLRSCCTAGATSTVGGGSGGGGFLQPAAAPSVARAPAMTDKGTPFRAMLPPGVSPKDAELSTSPGSVEYDLGVPGPLSASRLGRGLRRGWPLCRWGLDHRRGVVGRGQGDLDPPVLAPSIRGVVRCQRSVLREPRGAEHLRVHALRLEV